jgi:hypothetical protein
VALVRPAPTTGILDAGELYIVGAHAVVGFDLIWCARARGRRQRRPATVLVRAAACTVRHYYTIQLVGVPLTVPDRKTRRVSKRAREEEGRSAIPVCSAHRREEAEAGGRGRRVARRFDSLAGNRISFPAAPISACIHPLSACHTYRQIAHAR